MISMEAKHEIIAKHESGVRINDLANEYGSNPFTISTIIKQKEAIKKLQPSKGVNIISKLRTNIHDEMEQLLLLWIKEKQLAGDSVSEAIICEKAGAIFQDLKRDITEKEGESSQGGEGFKASRGWFDNFKKRIMVYRLSVSFCWIMLPLTLLALTMTFQMNLNLLKLSLCHPIQRLPFSPWINKLSPILRNFSRSIFSSVASKLPKIRT
ncbi:HTH CENPB-type domain-containing protein [Nephila pilipes]|uniref:HTH CENPB-type domain-containing protein n=1 Tax=Nephila pilipes TaxID=299642 RepID=A0A8X6T234_NEPPI|nr:HTH CENPB-type domain-containing protein [Nephila pilipes]